MRQMEGGWASTYLIDQSKTRLERLGFFKEVNVETPAVPGVDDQVDVNYSVEEQASGSIRSEEHTSELQSLMRISYAVFCLKKKKKKIKMLTTYTAHTQLLL